MSIDLLANVTYTEAQLVRYENRLVSVGLPCGEEAKVNRGYAMRDEARPPASPPGLANRSDKYTEHLEAVALHMETMREDNAVLIGTIEYEDALDRLALPSHDGPEEIPGYDDDGDPITIPNPPYVEDQEERAAAQNTIDNVTSDELALYDLRNPGEESSL
ncbi:MAG: hypothetical protein DRQ42_05795 [Gammaproteobacteria bacterium]|nr:MAG: hypothetical protein DRQ42_05795 [Gammaproteobacteria bacterium]